MPKISNTKFVEALKNIEKNYRTVYALGMVGDPITEKVISAKSKQYPSWYTATVQKNLRSLIGKNYFGFDCVNLVKAVLWGWQGDPNKSSGGAIYLSNNVPDVNADTMFSKCVDTSSNFNQIEIGSALWIKGHIGVYIGNGLAVESTSKWKSKVQITSVNCTKTGYNRRDWVKHGKLPYVEYSSAIKTTSISLPILQAGSKGEAVKTLQALLNKNGAVLNADGIFGSKTTAALKDFQRKAGIEIDGICGKSSWDKVING